MHVHFGMSGRFGVFAADTAPEVTAKTRLRLEGHGMVALLSAMTVDLVDESTYWRKQKLTKPACDVEFDDGTLWSKFSSSRKSVGGAAPNMFAGAEHRRAEILYKAGVHPDEPCSPLARSAPRVWFPPFS